jgi:hypothetical protein
MRLDKVLKMLDTILGSLALNYRISESSLLTFHNFSIPAAIMKLRMIIYVICNCQLD